MQPIPRCMTHRTHVLSYRLFVRPVTAGSTGSCENETQKDHLKNRSISSFCHPVDKHTATYGLGRLPLFVQAFFFPGYLFSMPLWLTTIRCTARFGCNQTIFTCTHIQCFKYRVSIAFI